MGANLFCLKLSDFFFQSTSFLLKTQHCFKTFKQITLPLRVSPKFYLFFVFYHIIKSFITIVFKNVF